MPTPQVVPAAAGTPLGRPDVRAAGVAVGPGGVHLGEVVPDGVLEARHSAKRISKGHKISKQMNLWTGVDGEDGDRSRDGVEKPWWRWWRIHVEDDLRKEAED